MDAYGHCVKFGMIMSRARPGVLTPGAQAHPAHPNLTQLTRIGR